MVGQSTKEESEVVHHEDDRQPVGDGLAQETHGHLCANVRIHRRKDDALMMDSSITFPDGDHFPIYLSETANGGVKLSDRGHTLMHISYEHDMDLLYEGARASCASISCVSSALT